LETGGAVTIVLIAGGSLVGFVLLALVLSVLPGTRRHVQVRFRAHAPGFNYVGPWSSGAGDTPPGDSSGDGGGGDAADGGGDDGGD
jgi:hypothetical protein